MKDISKFANVVGDVTGVANALDAVGSSEDKVFADAIVASEQVTVLEEKGIIVVRQTPYPNDILSFPIVRNSQLTWRDIDARNGTNALGSDLGASQLNAIEYKEVRPVTKTANVFLPDHVSLLNKVNFDLYTQMCARDAKRKKEVDALTTLTTEADLTHVFTAGDGSLGTGAVGAGSQVTPSDLLAARRVLNTGSDPVDPDFILMHNNQYEDFIQSDDLAPGATSPGAIQAKTVFDVDGNITRFNGMEIIVSPLLPSQGSPTVTADVVNANYEVVGHPVVIGRKGLAIGRGERQGITVYTEDSRRRHGQWKVLDMDYDNTILVQESIVLLRAAD